MSNFIKPLAISCGSLEGIGSITIIKAWQRLKHQRDTCFFVVSNADFLINTAKLFNLPLSVVKIKTPLEAIEQFSHALPVLDLPLTHTVNLGSPSTQSVDCTLQSLDLTIDFALQKKVRGIVTLPLDKYVVKSNGFDFIGHTEYLAYKSNAFSPEQSDISPVMLLGSPTIKDNLYSRLKVIPLTIHQSLKSAIATLNIDNIVQTIVTADKSLQTLFKIKNPRFLILGLNPHAGENGLMGDEEIKIITPAILKLRSQGLNIQGPIPSDTAFTPVNIANFDVIVGMYHDQVLTPFKTLLFNSGVNITLGLPFVRTSPDHGTAFELVKYAATQAKTNNFAPLKGISSTSTEAAILLATQLTKQ